MLRTRVRATAASGIAIGLAFAALFTALYAVDLLLPALAPRYGEPTVTTLRVPHAGLVRQTAREGGATLSYGHEGLIIPRGTVLDPANEAHKVALAFEAGRRPPGGGRLASMFVIYSTIALMLTGYLRRFGQSRVRLLRAQVGLLVLVFASMVVAKGMLLATSLPEFWIPMAAVPLWVALSIDRRTAFLIEVAVAFLAASLLRFDVLLLSVLLVRGIAATLFFVDRKHVQSMVLAGSLSGLCGALVYAGLNVVIVGQFRPLADLGRALDSSLVACCGGGLLGGLFASLLHEPAERLMGHASRQVLLDLTDLEHPLLQRMATLAPGSWEHARSMANLAEAAASAIGADALLTRVGAYYHDLGKTVAPRYFVENLLHDEPSPHDGLPPEESARVIVAHVVEGTRLLREGGVPEPVVEFAYTHHGTQLVEFFWHRCQEQGNPRGLSEEHFRYPGMKPETRETAILMLVDSIEAASRTIDPPEEKRYQEMIRRIVLTKLEGGQLDESGLTLQDLNVMMRRMASTLVSMHHHRVKYPWQREAPRSGPGSAAGGAIPLKPRAPGPGTWAGRG